MEWTRADNDEEKLVYLLKNGYVHARGHQVLEPEPHRAFVDRVVLKDRQMKDGDVSVIMKYATTADSGTYECRVYVIGARRKRATLKTKPICTINLNVPPGERKH